MKEYFKEPKYIIGFDDYKENGESSFSLYTQVKKGVYEANYERPKEIYKRDVALTILYVFGVYYMKYTKNVVTTEEDFDIEVEHFFFLKKYNLA